jgi:hypothetical protein
MPKPIKKGRKKKARNMRKYAHYVEDQKEGTTSTHLMKSDILDDKTMKPREKGPYIVYPSITTDESGYDDQTQREAMSKGEAFQFKNLKRAQKFEYGSWKKGRDRREAMQAYRKAMKKSRNKNK